VGYKFYIPLNLISMKGKGASNKVEKSIRLDDVHWNIIRGLVPFYGTSETEVVRTIVTMWLDQNLGSKTIEKLEELDAIKLKQLITGVEKP